MKRTDEQIVVLELTGAVDFRSSPRLRRRLRRIAKKRDRVVVLDLREVGFMDSSGAATLVNALGEARARGGDLRLAAPADSVLALLAVLNLEGVFGIFESVEAACRRGVNPALPVG